MNQELKSLKTEIRATQRACLLVTLILVVSLFISLTSINNNQENFNKAVTEYIIKDSENEIWQNNNIHSNISGSYIINITIGGDKIETQNQIFNISRENA